MLRNFLLVLVSSLLVFTSDAQDDNLVIKVHNKTGYDLDSLHICEGEYFTISKDDQIIVKTCKSVIVVGDELAGSIEGVAIGAALLRINAPKGCGTDMESIVKGTFECEIHYIEDEEGYYLDWSPLPPPPPLPKE